LQKKKKKGGIMMTILLCNCIIAYWLSPKNENVVIIYSPSCCSKLVWLSFFGWTKKKIFWRMLVTTQLTAPIDLDFLPTMEVNGCHQLWEQLVGE